ncbi:hypothetical protein BsWGS_19201 [Bradybaena similaris]
MSVTEHTLRKYKWSDLTLRPYQLEGVNWLLSCYNSNHGCILSDEMGLGKTCQIIATLTVIKGKNLTDKPHMVVCPRSVLENWELEFHRFSPTMDVLVYIGDKEARNEIIQKVKASKSGNKYNFDVLLTTYEMCLKDSQFLSTISWDTLIVDEGHRLKNCGSLLYTTLEVWIVHTRILLTGTPLQNNLRELYSLLSFVDSSKFRLSRMDAFVDRFSMEQEDMSELHNLLAPYILRRTKANVLLDLPEKKDVILYHGLSALQKKLYKAILTKDLEIFENSTGSSQARLLNTLMQLRKCVNHPYLFDGVEPEPFVIGDHLVEASHKLTLIDRLLAFLKEGGHKVLLFSQMSRMLDILQDYLGYRGYTYERLDGSVRGEERFLAVQNFNANDETFVFLLSTKAGGQGLNLTSADTVIFVDSDFNPQNDLQAAARAHRIGQERPVKIIRLVGRNTVEEIILHRAQEKLSLTDKVIDSADFTTAASSKHKTLFQTAGQLQEILKFGVDELLAEAKSDELVDFKTILGSSNNGQWSVENKDKHKALEPEDEAASPEEDKEKSTQSMYVFEGTDYSKEPSAADMKAFEQLILAEKEALQNEASGERALRTATSSTAISLRLPLRKPRRQLTPEELEERRRKRQEAAEKRELLVEKQQLAKAEAQRKKREALWKANKYTSLNIMLDSEGEEEEEDSEFIELDDGGSSDEETASHRKKLTLRHVIGDVTHPLDASTDNNIIVHCVDDSGNWGQGGLFSAISARSSQPETQYEFAEEMKDLALGDCHLIPIDDIESREEGHDLLALIVAQQRDKRSNKLSGIKLQALQLGLRRVYKAAKDLKASVHLPRIGHDTPGFNWYGTERLIHKHLAAKGIPTYIYYFPRKQAQKRKNESVTNHISKVHKGGISATATSSNSSLPTTSHNSTAASTSTTLPTLFSGVAVYFYNIPEEVQKKLRRFLIAYDGDVEKRMSHSTTHLVAEASTNKLELNDLIRDVRCRVVVSNWLEDCVSKGRLLPTEDYLIPLA